MINDMYIYICMYHVDHSFGSTFVFSKKTLFFNDSAITGWDPYIYVLQCRQDTGKAYLVSRLCGVPATQRQAPTSALMSGLVDCICQPKAHLHRGVLGHAPFPWLNVNPTKAWIGKGT